MAHAPQTAQRPDSPSCPALPPRPKESPSADLLRPAAPSTAGRPRQGPPRPASSSPRPVLMGPGRGRPESGGSSPGRDGAGCVWEQGDFPTAAGAELGQGGQEGRGAAAESCTTSYGRAVIRSSPPPAGHLWTLRLGASQSRPLHPTRKRPEGFRGPLGEVLCRGEPVGARLVLLPRALKGTQRLRPPSSLPIGRKAEKERGGGEGQSPLFAGATSQVASLAGP